MAIKICPIKFCSECPYYRDYLYLSKINKGGEYCYKSARHLDRDGREGVQEWCELGEMEN